MSYKRRTPKLDECILPMKCITFDSAAQDTLPEDVKAKMKAARDNAKLEAYHKQCPCWNSHNNSCYDDNSPCDRDCDYMRNFKNN